MAETSLEPSPDHINLKCVLVGDSGIGKSSSLISYTTNGFPTAYQPTTFDTYSVDVQVDHQWYKVTLCDTPGLDHFEQIRPLAYPDAHVFLMCFAVANPNSLESLRTKWKEELLEHTSGHAARLLVGLKTDQRDDASILLDLSMRNEGPVSREEAEKTCKELGALDYVECSALTQKNLKEVFDLAIWAAVKVLESEKSTLKNGKKSKKSKTKKGHKVEDRSNKNFITTKTSSSKSSTSRLRRLFCVGDNSVS